MKPTKLILAVVVATAWFTWAVIAGCYVDQPYTCHPAGSGCLAGCTTFWGFNCCKSPAQAGGPTCWWDETGDSVDRATGGADQGSDDIGYSDVFCSWTRWEWDCHGNPNQIDPTNTFYPVQRSYATGASCSGG